MFTLLLCTVLLTACATPRQWYSDHPRRHAAEQQLTEADAVVLAAVGDRLPAYEEGEDIYTDTLVSVIRGGDFEEGAQFTLRRPGGKVRVPGTSVEKVLIVDHLYPFPDKGGQVFLLLKQVGEKYDIIDYMALRDGRPVADRPENSVYMRHLGNLE